MKVYQNNVGKIYYYAYNQKIIIIEKTQIGIDEFKGLFFKWKDSLDFFEGKFKYTNATFMCGLKICRGKL